MKEWRNLELGETVTWHWNDFDGKGSVTGTITEVEKDHAILRADGMNLWIDDDTKENFTRA